MAESAAFPAPVGTKTHFKRRRLYIQHDLQFRYALLFVLITMLGGITGYVIQRLQALSSSHLLPYRILSLVLILTILGGIIYLSLFFTHKIAGPVYRFQRFLDDALKHRDISGRVQFRQGDELHEMAGKFNMLLEDVRAEITRGEQGLSQARDRLNALIGELGSSSEPPEPKLLAERLSEVQSLLENAKTKYKT